MKHISARAEWLMVGAIAVLLLATSAAAEVTCDLLEDDEEIDCESLTIDGCPAGVCTVSGINDLSEIGSDCVLKVPGKHLKIAGSITVEPGGTVEIAAAQVTVTGAITASDGSIVIHAENKLATDQNGKISAASPDPVSSAEIELCSQGEVSLLGKQGVFASGIDAAGAGGYIGIECNSLTIGATAFAAGKTTVTASGAQGGGLIEVKANSIAIRSQAVMSADGGWELTPRGEILIVSTADTSINGVVTANGTPHDPLIYQPVKIEIESESGTVSVGGKIEAKDGHHGTGGEIILRGDSIAVGGIVNVAAGIAGTGGNIFLEADQSIQIVEGRLLATADGTTSIVDEDDGGGTGGSINLAAGAQVSITRTADATEAENDPNQVTIDASGFGRDAQGGQIGIELSLAQSTLNIGENVFIDARARSGKGEPSPGSIEFYGACHLTINGTLITDSDQYDGMITLDYRGSFTGTGKLKTTFPDEVEVTCRCTPTTPLGDACAEPLECASPPLFVLAHPEEINQDLMPPCEGCGDNGPDDGELCDDGNVSNQDGCLTNCTPASCGDGFVHWEYTDATNTTLYEKCDPGIAEMAACCTCSSGTTSIIKDKCSTPGQPECKVGKCDAQAQCVLFNAPDESKCDPGKCHVAGTCTAGECQGVPRCNDNDPCTTDACNPDTGQCTHAPMTSGAACDDKNDCTKGTQTTCQLGKCKCKGANAACFANDGDDCEDKIDCTEGTTCKAGKCDPMSGTWASASKSCDDGNACTGDGFCNPLTKKCQSVPSSCGFGPACKTASGKGGMCMPHFSIKGNPVSGVMVPSGCGCVRFPVFLKDTVFSLKDSIGPKALAPRPKAPAALEKY